MPTTASYTVAFSSSTTASLRALTPRERREHDRLPNEGRQRDWLAGRSAAKRAVASRCGVSVEHVQLEPRSSSAPRCMVRAHGKRWAPLPLSISIAHCDGFAIAAVADAATRIGVDIERVDAIAAEHGRYFRAPDETSMDATLVWVLKEAAWKALGLSREVPFTAVRLHATRDGSVHGVSVDSAYTPARTRVMRRRDFVAAVLEIERGPQ